MPTCLACLRSHVATCLAHLRAHMPTCLACLCAHVPTCLACLLAHVPTCPTCSHANVPYVLTCQPSLRTNWKLALRAHLQKVSTGLFFGVKLIICPVLYWDEESLLIKVEARRVIRNASRHNESFKILISQIHLGFVISLINSRCGSCQTYNKQFFAKTVNGLIPIFYFLKIHHIRCLAVM